MASRCVTVVIFALLVAPTMAGRLKGTAAGTSAECSLEGKGITADITSSPFSVPPSGGSWTFKGAGKVHIADVTCPLSASDPHPDADTTVVNGGASDTKDVACEAACCITFCCGTGDCFSTLQQGADPCPFGYGTNCGGGDISPATRAQVANILSGILSNLSKNKALVQGSQTVRHNPSPKIALTENKATLEVRTALRDLVSRMQQRGQSSAAKVIGSMLASAVPDAGCKYFGAGCGTDHPIDDQTKAQVAAILGGIIQKLSSHK